MVYTIKYLQYQQNHQVTTTHIIPSSNNINHLLLLHYLLNHLMRWLACPSSTSTITIRLFTTLSHSTQLELWRVCLMCSKFVTITMDPKVPKCANTTSTLKDCQQQNLTAVTSAMDRISLTRSNGLCNMAKKIQSPPMTTEVHHHWQQRWI